MEFKTYVGLHGAVEFEILTIVNVIGRFNLLLPQILIMRIVSWTECKNESGYFVNLRLMYFKIRPSSCVF